MRSALFLIGFLFSGSVHSQTNNAINFNGTNYASFPAGIAVSQLNTFTVEAWVYWNGGGNGCIYSETILGNNNPMFSIIPRSGDGGGIELTFRDNAFTGLLLQPATGVIASNRWVHVAVVRTSATNMKIYTDGNLTDDANFTAPASWTPTSVNAGIRRRVSNSDAYGGKIDELRVWNIARTQAEIKAEMFAHDLAANTAGLVARYSFNETTGTVTANSSTNTPGSDGTLAGSPAFVASPVQYGANALHFDQADDKFAAPLLSAATSGITLETWIYHNGGTGTDHMLMSNGVAGTNGYAFFINTSHRLIVSFGGVGLYNTNISIPVNQWCHLALVINATGFIVYKDGVASYTNNVLPLTPGTGFSIGYRDGFGQPYDGLVDEVKLWNTARTAAEIQSGMQRETDPATPGLISYYTFNQGLAGDDNTGLTTVIDMTGNRNGTLTGFALTGTSSNFLAQSGSLILLPVRWLSFTAAPQEENVLLRWSTSQEENNEQFEIQHSVDGSSWTGIGTVKGMGNSSAVQSYQYFHSSPAPGRNYYRIKQTDLNGGSSYSKTAMAWFASDRTFSLLTNPVSSGLLRFRLNAPVSQLVSLYSAEGKMIWRKNLGAGVHSVDVSGIGKGIYFLQVGNGTERVIIQ